MYYYVEHMNLLLLYTCVPVAISELKTEEDALSDEDDIPKYNTVYEPDWH